MQTMLTWVIGIVCVVMTSLPILHTGFFRPHDYTHAARIVEMNRSLRAGEFPVRWSANFGFGYGMPLFNFYAPLPYYLAQIPYVLTQDAILSIKFLYILNSVLAFSGMYLFAREYWKDKNAGLVAATVFSFATYRALDLFVRGAIGEVMAMVLLPFALYGVMLLKSKPKAGIMVTSLSLAGVLLTHNLTGMIVIAVVILFGPLIERSRSFLSALIVGIVGSLGLSAFYVLPAFLEKGFTRIDETITVGYFDYHNHFVALRQLLLGTWGYGGSVIGMGDGISFALGWVTIVLMLVAVVMAFLFHKKNPNSIRQLADQISNVIIVLFFLAGSLSMATNKSVFLWERISLLKYMQFPWRFLAFSHVFAATLAGASVLGIEKHRKLALIAVGCVVGVTIGLNMRFFMPEKYIQNTDEYYASSPEFIRKTLSKTLNDYLPKAILDAKLPDPTVERLALFGSGSIAITLDRPTRLEARVDCPIPCQVDVRVFQFPGWKAIVDGKTASLEKNMTFPTYTLTVPSGDHVISVQLENSPIRKFGNVLTLVTSVVLVCIYGTYLYSRRY